MKKIITNIITALVVVLAAVIIYQLFLKPTPEICDVCGEIKDECVCEFIIDERHGKTITPKDLDRVQSRKVTGWFEMSGRGRDANWGISREADFVFNAYTEFTSRIISKKTENGKTVVVEERTFDKFTHKLDVEPKVRVDLSTLPINEFCDIVAVVGQFTDFVNSNPAAELLPPGTRIITNILNGQSLPVPERWKNTVLDKFSRDKSFRSLIRSGDVQGRTYRLTYTQNKKGDVVKFKAERVDGGKMTPEEQDILKKCNAFIDSDVVPDVNKGVGGTWTVDSRDMQEAFSGIDGNISGDVKFVRQNDKDGLWSIRMNPAELTIMNDDNFKTGNIKLNYGNATVEPKKLHSIRDMNLRGMIKNEVKSKHHLLFTAKISSWCEFKARVASSVIE